MKRNNHLRIGIAVGLLGSFAVWTGLIRTVDLRPIGPQDTYVGLASLNGAFHRLTGVHLFLYELTDLLSALPLGIVIFFAITGLIQWIQRKSILKVDRSILVLGGFYAVVIAAYGLFQKVIMNYRPILINGQTEASYPSSTTVLVLCVMITALLQLKQRVKKRWIFTVLAVLILGFSLFMVVGRLLSGVHWLTDIIGGLLLSAGLIALYCWAIHLFTDASFGS